MKRKIVMAGLTLFTTVLISCKDTASFTISGTIDHAAKQPMVFLQKADSSGEYQSLDSVKLSADGVFKFKKESPFPELYRLKIDTTQIDLAVQNGDMIEVNADLADNTHHYAVTGSDASNAIKQFNELATKFNEISNRISADFEVKLKAHPASADSLTKVLMPVYSKNQADFSHQAIMFIKNNQQSLAGFYAASTLDPVRFEMPLISYADGINGDLLKNPLVKKFVNAMVAAKPLSVGHDAPNFTINDSNGKPLKLSDYKGKWIMIDFWASWCVPCRQENPNVLKQYQHFHQKGFNVLGISLDKDKAAWQKAVSDDHLTWTQASDLNSFQGTTEQLYHIEAIPSNFIIDPQGKIAAKNVRGIDLEDFLNKTL